MRLPRRWGLPTRSCGRDIRSTEFNPPRPLDTRRNRADNTPMKGKSRRERIAAMSLAERDDLIPLARKVRADAIAW